MANNFAGISPAVQDNLQGACCWDQCPVTEMEDNQFLALLYYALVQITGVDPTDGSVTPEEIKTAAQDAWCALNMDTFCSIPPDKLKALILYLVNTELP